MARARPASPPDGSRTVVSRGMRFGGTGMASSHPSGYERSDADPRLIAAIALGLGVFLLLTPFALQLLYPAATQSSDMARDTPVPPQPRLEFNLDQSLAALRGREAVSLARYGWVDRQHGVARIPVERAMALLAQRGLPGWPSTVPRAP